MTSEFNLESEFTTQNSLTPYFTTLKSKVLNKKNSNLIYEVLLLHYPKKYFDLNQIIQIYTNLNFQYNQLYSYQRKN